MARFAWWVMMLLVAFPFQAAGAGEGYEYREIHPAGWLSSVAVSVNGSGDVAGYGRTAEGDRGFVLSAGTITQILPPGADGAWVSGLNGAGQVAGTAVYGGTTRAFVYSAGVYEFIVPEWAGSEASSIGEDGTVFGFGTGGAFAWRGGTAELFPYFSAVGAGNSSGVLVGVLDNAARMLIPGRGYMTIAPPGAISSVPRGINESGYVVMTATLSSGGRGYVYKNGFYILMTPPGWSSSFAMAVNDRGDVAGFGDSPDGRRGFLRTGPEFVEISFPGWSATEAVSVNDSSQVAGSGVTPSGETHAFVASPAGGGNGNLSPASAGGGCSVARGGRGTRLDGPSAALNSLLPLFPLLLLTAPGIRRRSRRPTPR